MTALIPRFNYTVTFCLLLADGRWISAVCLCVACGSKEDEVIVILAQSHCFTLKHLSFALHRLTLVISSSHFDQHEQVLHWVLNGLTSA